VIRHATTIVHAWLRMDFFGDSRRDEGSALTSTIFSQSFFAFLLAALLYDTQVRVVPYTAANLSLSTLLVGIGALADPQAALRRRRADAALLHTAPLFRGTASFARACHGAFYVVLITTGMAIPPAIFAFRVGGDALWIVPAYLVHASVLAGICAGTIALVLRVVERTSGRGSALLLAGTLRALLLGGGFIAFALCLGILEGSTDDLPLGRVGAWCWPPYWSAKWLANPGDWTALGILAGSSAILLLGNAMLSEVARPRARAARPRARGPLTLIERRIAGRGPLLGATRFVATMLYRSAPFRARVLPLLGVPIAMTALAFVGDQGRGQLLLLGMTLQFPAIYLPFLIAFLPSAERASAGHVFATSPHASIELAREASLIALTTRILTPVQLLAALLATVGGIPLLTAASLGMFSWGAAVLLAQFQLAQLRVMPFTVSESEEEASIGTLLGFSLLVAVAGGMFALVAGEIIAVAGAAAVAGTAVWRLLRPSRLHD